MSGGEEEGGRERASATALERPGVCCIVMKTQKGKLVVAADGQTWEEKGDGKRLLAAYDQ